MGSVDHNTSVRSGLIRKILIGTGVALLAPSGCYFLLGILGLAPTEFLAIGPSSGLRTVASVAVAGCLLAAIGYWDD